MLGGKSEREETDLLANPNIFSVPTVLSVPLGYTCSWVVKLGTLDGKSDQLKHTNDKSNCLGFAFSQDSDQPSLIKVINTGMKKVTTLSFL